MCVASCSSSSLPAARPARSKSLQRNSSSEIHLIPHLSTNESQALQEMMLFCFTPLFTWRVMRSACREVFNSQDINDSNQKDLNIRSSDIGVVIPSQSSRWSVRVVIISQRGTASSQTRWCSWEYLNVFVKDSLLSFFFSSWVMLFHASSVSSAGISAAGGTSVWFTVVMLHLASQLTSAAWGFPLLREPIMQPGGPRTWERKGWRFCRHYPQD